jgi:hypothetical protein
MSSYLKNQPTLVFGFGQAGSTISKLFVDTYQYLPENHITINSNVDSNVDANSLLLKSPLGDISGSGKNPAVTFDSIIPHNVDRLKEYIIPKLSINTKEIIIFASLGGGTGSALTYWTCKEILIPRIESGYDYRIVVVPIFGFEWEGNPINTNSAAMLNMIYGLSGKINILPVFNDLVHQIGGRNIYERTNENICSYVYSTVNFEGFAGKRKDVSGLSTLDYNEFMRVLKPQNGFLSRVSVALRSLDNIPTGDKFLSVFDTHINKFDIRSSKSMVIMFRTVKGKNVGTNVLENVHDIFPNQIKIFAESEAVNDPATVDFLCNGIDLPQGFIEKYESAMESVAQLKQLKKDAKKENKTTLKVAKKSLFNL